MKTRISPQTTFSLLEDSILHQNNLSVNQQSSTISHSFSSLPEDSIYRDLVETAFTYYHSSPLENFSNFYKNDTEIHYTIYNTCCIIEQLPLWIQLNLSRHNHIEDQEHFHLYQYNEKVLVVPSYAYSFEDTFSDSKSDLSSSVSFLVLHFIPIALDETEVETSPSYTISIYIEVLSSTQLSENYIYLHNSIYQRKGYLYARKLCNDVNFSTDDPLINCSHSHKGDYLVYTNNKLFYEPKLRFEYCTEQLDDPSFLHSFSCSSFENLHPDSDLSYRSQFDTSFSLLQGGHSFIHTHYSSKTTTTLDDYPFLLSLYQICSYTLSLLQKKSEISYVYTKYLSTDSSIYSMYNALYTHFVSIYSLFDKNYHNVESDLCRIIFLYSFLPFHSLQSGCSLIEVISELYCSTQITLYCPPTHLYSIYLFGLLYPFIQYFRQIPVDIVLYNLLNLLCINKQSFVYCKTIATIMIQLSSILIQNKFPSFMESYSMLYSSLYQFHESFKQGQIREESIQQILNHMMVDVKSCSSLSIDPIVIYSMTSYYSNQCSSTSTEESGQKDRFVDSSPNNVCSPLLSSLSNDLLYPQLIHSFLLANQNNVSYAFICVIYYEMVNKNDSLYSMFYRLFN